MNNTKFVQIERREKFTESEFWQMFSALTSAKWQNLLPPQLPIEDLPTKRAKIFVTPADAPIPDCLTCGACCTFLFAVSVSMTDDVPPETIWDITEESGEIVVDSYLKRDAKTLFCTALKPTADGSRAVFTSKDRKRAESLKPSATNATRSGASTVSSRF